MCVSSKTAAALDGAHCTRVCTRCKSHVEMRDYERSHHKSYYIILKYKWCIEDANEIILLLIVVYHVCTTFKLVYTLNGNANKNRSIEYDRRKNKPRRTNSYFNGIFVAHTRTSYIQRNSTNLNQN